VWKADVDMYSKHFHTAKKFFTGFRYSHGDLKVSQIFSFIKIGPENALTFDIRHAAFRG
jgi:hypothetical protein